MGSTILVPQRHVSSVLGGQNVPLRQQIRWPVVGLSSHYQVVRFVLVAQEVTSAHPSQSTQFYVLWEHTVLQGRQCVLCVPLGLSARIELLLLSTVMLESIPTLESQFVTHAQKDIIVRVLQLHQSNVSLGTLPLALDQHPAQSVQLVRHVPRLRQQQ